MTDTEKAALERRIDELCAEVERLRNQLHDQQDTAEHNFVRNAREYKRVRDENAKLQAEVERLHADQAHWELGNCPSCPNVADLQEALEQNAKLREYAAKAWNLFVRHGAVHACDLSEVDAVRDGLRELGIELG